jgi:sulfatase maturation enzyme AslB (radical SAM superfamily)
MRQGRKDVISALALVLTPKCNLKCGYCFENSKTGQPMRWSTLRAALDVGMEHGERDLKILFTGGEPLLEYQLIRKAVFYVRDNQRRGSNARFTLLTNGMLLDDKKLKFLSASSCRLQLSFDGVEPAQDVRGRRTFEQLDKLLTTMSERHKPFFRKRLSVSVTVTPQTVPHLADSLEYLLSRGVRNIAPAPIMTDSSGWKVSRTGELEVQFSRMVRASLSHLGRTGQVPFRLFQGWEIPGSRARGRRVMRKSGSMQMCRATQGRTLAIDPDGEVFACVTLSGTYQRFKSELLRRHAGLMRIGNICSKDFISEQTGFTARANAAPMFCGKEHKFSSYRACSECEYLGRCVLCPVSIGHIPGNRDPDRVPDFCCAFNYLSLKCREQFLNQALFGEPVAVAVRTGRDSAKAGRQPRHRTL